MPMPRKPDPHKTCAQCGKVMKRKEYNGRIEDMRVFRQRTYCDRECMARAFIKIDPKLTTLRKRARKYVKGSCEVCGGTHMLAVHHMNENPADNRPSNIRTLCNSCHKTWHWHFGKGTRARLSNGQCDTAPTD